MSLASPKTRPAATRDQLVSVLQAIEGIEASSVAPDQATAGASWPRWVQTTYDGHLCTLAKDTYLVLVTLPAGYQEQTVDQGDAFRDVVGLELAKVARVELVEPVQITFGDRQSMPGLRFRVTTT
jgi:hypothetical protein